MKKCFIVIGFKTRFKYIWKANNRDWKWIKILLIYADVNLFDINITMTKEIAHSILDSSKKIGLERNAEKKIKCVPMLMFRQKTHAIFIIQYNNSQ
jgi:hypothetical protein